MWLFSSVPEDPQNETVMEMHSADELYYTVKKLMHAIRTEDQDTQQNAAHRMIKIAKPSKIRRWSESKLMNRKPLILIPMGNAHLVDFKWNDDEQAKLRSS
jgi:hypothetical protein